MNAFWITVVLAVLVSAVSASEDSKSAKISTVDVRNIVNCADGDQAEWVKLDSQTVAAKGKLWKKVKKTITYPRDGTGNHELTCIRVTDLIADGTGGTADIEDGGLGFRFATIHFESAKSHGFKYSVEIYGKPIKA